jgi:hypothetical protein
MSVPGRYLLAAACAASVLAAGVWACLPELAPVGPATAAYCGNGVIDVGKDAGPVEECDPSTADAGVKGCSAICTIECPPGGFTDNRTGHCYFLGGDGGGVVTYEEAKSHCRDEGAHVVTFASDEEYRLVHDWYTALPGVEAAFWVGLTVVAEGSPYYTASNADEPGYAIPGQNCPGCYGRPEPATGYFAQLFVPDAGAPALRTECVTASRLDVPWYRASCSLPRYLGQQLKAAIVCEREPPGARSRACDGGQCIQHPSTTKRYLYVSVPANASEAAASCKKLGGALVMFDSREEREELGREIAHVALRGGPRVATFWIGLSKAADGWRWDDGAGADLRPTVWGDREPVAAPAGARAYVQLGLDDDYDTTLAHADTGSGTARPFVCQYR